MLAFDLLALIRSLGNVDDTSTFRTLVMPQILQTIMQLQQHACVTNNMEGVQKMLDSGILKAMLDIFVDYFINLLRKS